jgi:hypothetical protein
VVLESARELASLSSSSVSMQLDDDVDTDLSR